MESFRIGLKDIPEDGAFGACKRHLQNLNFNGKIMLRFTENVNGLGNSGHDHITHDVRAFLPDGSVKGWDGCYGGSYAGMYASNGVAGQANLGNVNSPVPPEHCILEIVNHWQGRWCYIYANPVHQTKMLPSAGEVTDREKKILAIFRSLKAGYRKEYLLSADVQTTELQALVNKGFLKCHKGKMPVRNGRNFDLAGAQVTNNGANACQGVNYY